MRDVFRPRTEPAKTLYDAFQDEATKREGRTVSQWIHEERHAVWRTAVFYAHAHGMLVPSLDDIQRAEGSASGSVDYGAKWAYRVAEIMQGHSH